MIHYGRDGKKYCPRGHLNEDVLASSYKTYRARSYEFPENHGFRPCKNNCKGFCKKQVPKELWEHYEKLHAHSDKVSTMKGALASMSQEEIRKKIFSIDGDESERELWLKALDEAAKK